MFNMAGDGATEASEHGDLEAAADDGTLVDHLTADTEAGNGEHACELELETEGEAVPGAQPHPDLDPQSPAGAEAEAATGVSCTVVLARSDDTWIWDDSALPKRQPELMEELLAIFDAACSTHGGPDKYLQQVLCDSTAKQSFAEVLVEILPFCDTIKYSHQKGLKDECVWVHPCVLNFHRRASPKLSVDRERAHKLAAEVLSDGFVSLGEPLRVTQQPDLDTCLAIPGCAGTDGQLVSCFSYGYIKGMNRACVLLCLIHLMLAKNINIKEELPHFWESCRAISVEVCFPTQCVCVVSCCPLLPLLLLADMVRNRRLLRWTRLKWHS